MFGKLTLGREERGDQLDCPPATEAIRVDGDSINSDEEQEFVLGQMAIYGWEGKGTLLGFCR